MALWTLSRDSPRISSNKESIIIAESSVRTKRFATRHFRTYWLFYDNNSIVVEKELLESYCVHRNSRNRNCLCTLTKFAALGRAIFFLRRCLRRDLMNDWPILFSIVVTKTKGISSVLASYSVIVCVNLESSCA